MPLYHSCKEMKSNISHAVLDYESRKQKASSIIGILKSYKDLRKCKVLDIGTGSGVIAHEIGKICREIHSVDIVDERIIKNKFKFKKIKDERLPYEANKFDIVISNHVMAHTKDGEMHLQEINRVLKHDGIVYLSMLNRLWPLEPNFNLLFLSWLPKRIADFYVRLFGKGKCYDVTPLTYFSFKQKVSRNFSFEDITLKVIKRNLNFPNLSYKILKMFSPVWIFILRKRV